VETSVRSGGRKSTDGVGCCAESENDWRRSHVRPRDVGEASDWLRSRDGWEG
jgi:hypothetical protein